MRLPNLTAVARPVVTSIVAAAVLVPLPAQAAENDIVFLVGRVKDTFTRRQTKIQKKFCDAGKALINLTAIPELLPALEGQVWDYCGNKPKKNRYDLYISYTHCSMVMNTATAWMRLTVPPGASEPEMVMWPKGGGIVYYLPLETALTSVNANSPGENGRYSGPGLGNPLASSEMNGYRVENYRQRFSGSPLPMGAGTEVPSNIPVKVSNDVTAWVAPEAPGADVVRAFHQNFSSLVTPPAGASSAVSAALAQGLAFAEKGVPIYIESVTELEVMGFINKKGKTQTWIDQIDVHEWPAELGCGPTAIPQGLTKKNILEMTSQELEEAPTGGSQNPSPGDVLKEIFKMK